MEYFNIKYIQNHLDETFNNKCNLKIIIILPIQAKRSCVLFLCSGVYAYGRPQMHFRALANMSTPTRTNQLRKRKLIPYIDFAFRGYSLHTIISYDFLTSLGLLIKTPIFRKPVTMERVHPKYRNYNEKSYHGKKRVLMITI